MTKSQSFSEVLDDISLVLNVKRLFVVSTVLSVPCVISVWCPDRWSRDWAAALKYSVRGQKPIVGVNLGDCALENKFSIQEHWI